MSRLIARRLFCEYTVTFCHAAGSYRQNRRRGEGHDAAGARAGAVLPSAASQPDQPVPSGFQYHPEQQRCSGGGGRGSLPAYERYPQLREKEKLPRWLLKITANEARRLCQRRGRTVSLDDLPTEPAIPGRETGDDTLWQAVQTLPQDQREAVVLFYYEDLPTEEIARIVGRSAGAVRVRLSRAREKLRSILKEGDYG